MSDPEIEIPDTEDIVLVAVMADLETSLPAIALSVNGERVGMEPDEAFNLGMMLIQAGHGVQGLYAQLLDKSVEERQSILAMEALFHGPDSGGDVPPIPEG